MVSSDWNHAHFDEAWQAVEAARVHGRLRDATDGGEQLLQAALASGTGAYPEAGYDLALAQLTLARVLRATGRSQRALSLVSDARQGFEKLEKDGIADAPRMTLICVGEQAECLIRLGRLDEAATICEDSINRARLSHDENSAAVNYARLGSVRLRQRRYQQALSAYGEATQRFEREKDLRSLATVSYQTGSLYLETRQLDAAESAYKRALGLYTQLEDVAAQADALTQLGSVLQSVPGRAEEAVAFYRDASGKYVSIGDIAGESRARTNLSYLLLALRRLDEAREEIERSLVCQQQLGTESEPWKSWSILEQIDTAAGNAVGAQKARREAIASYLAYRRQGGQNDTKAGQLCSAVMQSLLAGDQMTAGLRLQQTEAIPNLPDNARALVLALKGIVAGNRSRTLADDPTLEYAMAAEVLYVIEKLEAAGREH